MVNYHRSLISPTWMARFLILMLTVTACGSESAVERAAAVDRQISDSPGDVASTPPPTTDSIPAAAESAAPSVSVTLEFESYNYGSDDLGGKGTQMLIDEFEAQHPDITIEPIGTPAGDIHTSIQAAAAAGDAPDVAQIGWSKWPFVLDTLPWVPLQDIAPSPEAYDDHVAGMIPSTLEIGQDDQGRQVGLPYTLSTATMMVNADLFRQAGLDPDAPPETWREAQDAALAIVDATEAEGIYVNAANEAKSDFITQSLINSNGGRLLSDDGDVQFDSPEAIEALDVLRQLTVSGAQPAITESEATALFEAGQLGMYITSTALLGGLIASSEGVFELTTAGLPAFGDKPVGPTNSGGGLFVFAEEPAEQAAAWEFVTFLTSKEGMTIVAEVIGYLPLRPAIVDDPDYLADFFAEDDRLQPAMEQLDTLVPYQFFSGDNATQARELLQDEGVAPVMFTGADPQQVLPEVATQVRNLLEQQ